MISLETARLVKHCQAYGAVKVSIFGSYARKEQTPDSDVDILVTFAEPVSLLTLAKMQRELGELLDRRVDLFTEAALSPYLRKQILDEQWVIYEAA